MIGCAFRGPFGWNVSLSYTNSLCIYAPVQADLFAINLRKPLKSAWAFSDWEDFDVYVSDKDIAEADAATPENAAAYFRSLRAAGRQTRGWHFAQSQKTRYLTLTLPHWTNDWPRILLGLSILRQVLPTSGDGQPGYILVHQFGPDGGKTLGSVLMRHGTSAIAGPREEITQKIIKHAAPLTARIKAMSKLPKPHIVDQSELLDGALQPA